MMRDDHPHHAPPALWQRGPDGRLRLAGACQMAASRPPAFGGRPTVCSSGLQPSLRELSAVFLAKPTLSRTPPTVMHRPR